MASNSISEFMRYLAAHPREEESLPALTDLSAELGVSVASLREQLEVARALGLVDVRPRIGIRRRPYSFLCSVRQSLNYAMALDDTHFQHFADLRKHVEAAYWFEAVKKLRPEDHDTLRGLIASAWEKLNGQPIQIPHEEHRQLHLAVYERLDNPFVSGILEAYWDAYESIGLNVFTNYSYLREVWGYHQRMVDSICGGDFESGYQALLAHTDMLTNRLGHHQGNEQNRKYLKKTLASARNASQATAK